MKDSYFVVDEGPYSGWRPGAADGLLDMENIPQAVIYVYCQHADKKSGRRRILNSWSLAI